jgi:hypothetical protein
MLVLRRLFELGKLLFYQSHSLRYVIPYCADDFNAMTGYRRVTLEADSRHVIFRKFVERCGFSLDAVLRKHRIVHNRNRDTALYSMLNSDWEDNEIKLKQHIGVSVKPRMHNPIEIDSGKDVEMQIIRDKKLAEEKAKAAGLTATVLGPSKSVTKKNNKKNK